VVAKFEFDLNDADGRYKFKVFSKAVEMSIAIWEIDQLLRRRIKYDESLSDEQREVLESVREEVGERLRENEVEFALDGY